MSLSQRQRKFARMVGELLVWCYSNGFEVTFGDAYRPPERAIRGSFHSKRLAIDLNLFIDGVYREDTKSYTPLGLYWESLGGSWGGRFSAPDGNHFSLGE